MTFSIGVLRAPTPVQGVYLGEGLVIAVSPSDYLLTQAKILGIHDGVGGLRPVSVLTGSPEGVKEGLR